MIFLFAALASGGAFAFDCDSIDFEKGIFSPGLSANADTARFHTVANAYRQYLDHLESGKPFDQFANDIFRPPLQWMLDSYHSGEAKLGNNTKTIRFIKDRLKKGLSDQEDLDAEKRLIVENQRLHEQELQAVLRREKLSLRDAMEQVHHYVYPDVNRAHLEDDLHDVLRHYVPGQLPLPIHQPWSKEDFINIFPFPVFPLGLTNRMVRVDGEWQRRDAHMNHDDDHRAEMNSLWFDFGTIKRKRGQKELARILRSEISTRLRCTCVLFSQIGEINSTAKLLMFSAHHENSTYSGSIARGSYFDSLKANLIRETGRLIGPNADRFERNQIFEDVPEAKMPPLQRNVLLVSTAASMIAALNSVDKQCRSKGKDEKQEQRDRAATKVALTVTKEDCAEGHQLDNLALARANDQALVNTTLAATYALRPALAEELPRLSTEQAKAVIESTLSRLEGQYPGMVKHMREARRYWQGEESDQMAEGAAHVAASAARLALRAGKKALGLLSYGLPEKIQPAFAAGEDYGALATTKGLSAFAHGDPMMEQMVSYYGVPLMTYLQVLQQVTAETLQKR